MAGFFGLSGLAAAKAFAAKQQASPQQKKTGGIWGTLKSRMADAQAQAPQRTAGVPSSRGGMMGRIGRAVSTASRTVQPNQASAGRVAGTMASMMPGRTTLNQVSRIQGQLRKNPQLHQGLIQQYLSRLPSRGFFGGMFR